MKTLVQIIAKHDPQLPYEKAESLTRIAEIVGIFSPIRVHKDVALYNEHDIRKILKLFDLAEQGLADEEAVQVLKAQEGLVPVVSGFTRFQSSHENVSNMRSHGGRKMLCPNKIEN